MKKILIFTDRIRGFFCLKDYDNLKNCKITLILVSFIKLQKIINL